MDAKWYYREILANYGPAAAAAFNSLVRRVGRGYKQDINAVLDKMRGAGYPIDRPGQKRSRDAGPQPSRAIMRSYLPNPGIYRGRLVTGPLHKPGFSRVVKNGFVQEKQYSGEQHMKDCLYVGASSYNESDLHYAICVSIVRKYYTSYAQAPQEFENVEAIITPSKANESVALRCVNVQKAPQNTTDVFNLAGVTLGAAASLLQTKMVERWLEGYVPAAMFGNFGYHDTTDNDAYLIGGQMNLEDMVFSCWSRTYMNIQATTKADDGSSFTTDITQNPLVGKLFYFKDKLPDIRPDVGLLSFGGGTIAAEDWGAKYLNEHRIAAPYITPGQVAAPPVTELSAIPVGSWKSVPLANAFRNVLKEGYVQLDPSNIKRSQIRFKFVGKLIDWMKQYTRFDKDTTLGTADGGLDYAFGTSMLLAVEKRVRTGDNVVRVSVHFDTVYGARYVKYKRRVMSKSTYIESLADPE